VAGVSNKGEKIAMVEDLCSYSRNTIENDFTDFGGVVSTRSAVDNTTGSGAGVCGYPDVDMQAIIDGSANATNITAGAMTVMTEEQVWQNDIQNWTDQGCYIPDPWGPSIWGRMEGSTSRQSSYDRGLAFFLTVPDLPAALQKANESAVGYVYFNESGSFGEDRKVKGVTNEDLSWFRLDQDHVAHWSMDTLAYD